MKNILTTVTYIDTDDLFLKSKTKNINDINFSDIKEKKVFIQANILILKINGNYRILKSKY
jgi:hypothetical protein